MDEITNESQMMQINKFIETSVGADLSAFGGFLDIRIKKLIAIISI